MEFNTKNWETAVFEMVDKNHRNRAQEHEPLPEIVVEAVREPERNGYFAAASMGAVFGSALLVASGAPVGLLVVSSALFIFSFITSEV